MILAGILLSLSWINLPELSSLDSEEVCSIVILIFGSLQVYSIYQYPRLDLLRALSAWIAGCFWLWVGVSTYSTFNVANISAIVLGLSNLYGFIINFNLLVTAWQKY